MEQVENVTAKWLGALSVIVGLWLVIAPFSLGLTAVSAYWNSIAVGLLAIGMGSYQYAQPSLSWPSWVNFVAGLWLIISPYIFNPDQGAAFTNAVISGVILGLVALFAAIAASAAVIESQERRHRVQLR